MARVSSLGITMLAGVLASTPAPAAEPPAEPAAAYRQWVEEMKQADRGPFSRIRWFCKDGTRHDPKAYACADRGGGAQHGEWTDKVRQMRANGYYVANILEDLDLNAFQRSPDVLDIYNHMLFEQFLIAHDDGWIYRKARYYRGALQAEGEIEGARKLMLTLLKEPEWIEQRYLALRAGARLLPHGVSDKSISAVRDLSAALAGRDPGFMNLRNKIHARPEAGDAVMVREYAKGVSNPGLAADLEQLASRIESLFSASASLRPALEELLRRVKSSKDMQDALKQMMAEVDGATAPADRYAATARALARLRELWPRFERPESRLALLNASLLLEDEHFAQAAALEQSRTMATRRQQLDWLALSAEAAYGVGLISSRERSALSEQFASMSGQTAMLVDYKAVLDYAALVPGWATQWLRFHFQQSGEEFAAIEPRVELFTQGQLRASPLFFYAHLVDTLLRDANRLAGVRRALFGADVGGGLRALNPGLARGTLRVLNGAAQATKFSGDGIYLLPETIAELPPVAGILTRGEGNPLSHVQLLARNLGIPNVAVDEALVDRLRPFDGKRVVLAVSPGGAVQLLDDAGQAEALFGNSVQPQDVLIRVDVAKLDLARRNLIPLKQLRAADSGRVVGPKAAKLGELKMHYPEAVADGLAIPFGIFRELLDQPMPGAGKSVSMWMVGEYAYLAAMPESDRKVKATEEFRQRLEAWVQGASPPPEFKARLRQAMRESFGEEGSYGVFVRSDTNVEDLAGFTGAGLNLTVPHVVGFEPLMEAIARVWASPFSARSFAWRQSRMDRPEHVYPAVLLLKSVPNEKSGVMVTSDVDTGDPNTLSVAVNEGVGGAVDGQAAESLRIDRNTGEVKLLAQATAPYRRVLPAQGGIEKVPVSGDEAVLKDNEIAQLIELVRDLPARFPAITDAEGMPAPADIEFGFLNGRLQLFQIRPFLESTRARSSDYLRSLDSTNPGALQTTVRLDQMPGDVTAISGGNV
ncbi:MAG: PEP/pyruvate-binding domain-containing protein [Chromatiales bacterium]